MFLCRVRKSRKGQAFCAKDSRSRRVRTHKHNLCRVRRRLGKAVCASRSPHAPPAKKQLLVADDHEE